MSYTNDNLAQIFMNLLREKRLNQAILLDAPWGSGKTYFIKNHLIMELKAAAKKSGSDYEHILYISLFGMSQPQEITDAIYSSYVTQLVKKKAEHETGKKLSDSINFTNLFSVGSKLALTVAKTKGIETDTLPGIEDFLTLHSTIIIFDDLERCKIDYEIVYGYLNNLVEHSDAKVILVANSANFREQDIQKQQEKLIGLTIKYHPNYVEIYENLVNSDYISTDSLKSLLSDKKIATWTIDNLTAFDHLNMRTLIYALVNFDMICRQIETIPHSEQDIWDKLLLEIYRYTLMCSIKIRAKEEPLDAWKSSLYHPANIMFSSPHTTFTIIGFHFVNTFLTDHYIDIQNCRDTIAYRLDVLSHIKKNAESKENQAYNKLIEEKYLDYTLPELLALARQLPLDIRKDYYSYTQFSDIIILLLSFKKMYPDFQSDFQEIIHDCQARMIEYITSNKDANNLDHLIYLGDQVELEKEYEEIIAPLWKIMDQREPNLPSKISETIELWGEALLDDYENNPLHFQKRIFQCLNLDWAINKIKESSIRDLRFFTKTIRYFYISENVSVTIEDRDAISRFLPMVQPLEETEKDPNRKRAFTELIDLLHKLLDDSTKKEKE